MGLDAKLQLGVAVYCSGIGVHSSTDSAEMADIF